MSWSHNLLFWLVALIVGGPIVIAVVCCFVLVLVARFQRRYIRRLVPVCGDQGQASHRTIAEINGSPASSNTFIHVGTFCNNERAGILKTDLDLCLSDDSQIMLLMYPSRESVDMYQLISRAADNTWLITSEFNLEEDLSGLYLIRILSGCSLAEMLRYHCGRIASHSVEVVPFDSETVILDIYNHDQLRVQLAVQSRLARWASHRQDCYTTTWRGAFKVVWTHFKSMPLDIVHSFVKQYKALAASPTES